MTMDDPPDIVQIARGSYIAQAAAGGTATVIHYDFAAPAPVSPERLREAAEVLARLPTDSIPPLAALPAGSQMSLAPNPLFTARRDELQALALAFRDQPARASPSVAITGIPGAGKTQLATEFVHRYGRYFDGGVFWLAFGEPNAIAAEVAACGGSGRMELRPDFDVLVPEERARLVMSAWRSELPRLLVFDNCEDEALVSQWRPPTGGSRVLITSRRHSWDPALGVTSLVLETLDRCESIALLRRYRADLAAHDAAVADIAGDLGDLPLALHLAGSYLWRYRDTITAADYLGQLRHADALVLHRSLTKGGISPTGHEQHVARSFAVSYDRLDSAVEADVLAKVVLARASHLAAGEVIPRELIAGPPAEASLDDDDLDARLAGADAVGRLVDLGLMLTGPNGGVRLHRLVAAYVRATADMPGAREDVCEQLLRTFGELHDHGLILRATELEPHMRAVTDEALEREPEMLTRALCNAFGGHLRRRGDATAAVPYLEVALRCAVALWGSDDPSLARDLNDLGLALMRIGALESARACFEAALPGWHAAGNEPDYAATLDNLGQLEEEEGDRDRAEQRYLQALRIREAVLGPLHERTAVTLTNLGNMHHARGDFDAARRYYERSLQARRSTLGETHLDTGLSYFHLALANQVAGDAVAAAPLFAKAVAAYSNALGDTHLWTLSALAGLASVATEEADAALPSDLIERVRASRARIFAAPTRGSDVTLNNIGFALWTRGDFGPACETYLDALRVGEHTMGVEDPSHVTVLNNLGMVWQWLEDFDAASGAFRRAQDLIRNADNPDPILAARVANNYGFLLIAAGDLATARTHLEAAYARRRELLGAEHADTAVSQANLGLLASAEGDADRSCALTQRAVASASLSNKSARSLAHCLHRDGVVALRAGALERARASLARAVDLRRSHAGSRHPDLALTLAESAAVLERLGDVDAARAHLLDAEAICESRLIRREGDRPYVHSLTVRVRDALRRLGSRRPVTP